MGDIKKVSTNSLTYQNDLISLLRNEDPNTKRQFKLKGPSSFLFSNFAMLALAACGGGGGGGGSSTPTPPPSNSAPNMGANTTFNFTEDTEASFSIGAPTDADGDSLTITVTSIPAGGVLTLVDGTVLTTGSTLTITQLEMITFTPNSNVNDDISEIGTLVLTVSDGQGGTDSATFSFSISAVNDAPSDITLSSLSIDENSIGSVVGTISSSDVDSTSATYTLSGDDSAFFEISADGELKLKDNIAADFEAKSSYEVTIIATDSLNAVFSKTFSIAVTDLNDAPTSISLASLFVSENIAGASFGSISVIDQDINTSYTFAVTGDDKDSFEIVEGALKFKDTISADFETKNTYSVTLTATDSAGVSVSENLTLVITDGKDPETVSGTVVDGYVSGSTVKILDIDGNVLATTTTDELGNYSLNLDDNKGVKIVADGGIDTSTGEAVTVTLTASKDSKYVSAITTIIEASGTDSAAVLENLGLPADFDLATSNPLESLEAQKVNANLINVLSAGEALLESSGLADGEGDELILAELVKTLKVSSDFSSELALKTIIDASASQLSADIQTKVVQISQEVAAQLVNTAISINNAASISQIATYQKLVVDNENSLISKISTAISSGTSLVVETLEQLEDSAKEAALELSINVSPFITLDAIANVKENILGGDGVAIASATDPEGEKITFTLTGDDAALFSVNSDGRISFVNSPNYSAPLDKNADNSYKVNLIATDASGNASSKSITINVLDVKGQGQAIDGYLVGATVWADLDGDGVIDSDEPTTTTDSLGNFGLDTDLAAGTVLYVTGGYDLGTGKPNEQVFKLTVSESASTGASDLVISPVSTQISRAYAKGTVTLDEAQTKIAAAYGLSEAFPDITSFDPIALAYSATSQEQAEAALTAQARNIMVSTLGDTSKKVAEYFTTEIAPVVRTQITDLFKTGTEVLGRSTWDSQVDLRSQPRITIELEGFEELLAKASDTFNDKIVEAILNSTDLTKLFEMKKDGTGQFDIVIQNATTAIIQEIKNTVLEEMGFDPATNYQSFVSLDDYEGETVTFLGATKTMGEWAVLISDVLDSEEPSPFDNRVNFGPDGGVTDWAGKHFAEQISKVARHLEVITGKNLSELTDSQIDDLVDMGMEYNRGTTYSESNSRWVPFDEYGQQLWEQTVHFNYNGERFRFDSNGNRIEGNTGQWLLTPDQIKSYLKNPSIQLKDGNWGNDFTTYNWTSTQGDLGIYLALAKARSEEDVTSYMDALTPTEDSITLFSGLMDGFFSQGTIVFQNLVSSALDFTLDKFTDFVEKTFEMDRDEVWLNSNSKGLPVSTIVEKTIDGQTYELKTTSGIEWLVRSGGNMNFSVNEEGDFTYSIVGGPDADRFRIDDNGSITFKDNAPGEFERYMGTEVTNDIALGTDGFKLSAGWHQSIDHRSDASSETGLKETYSALRPLVIREATDKPGAILSYFEAFNLENISNVFSGLGGNSPTLSYKFISIPAVGESGNSGITLTLTNERDWYGRGDTNAPTFYEATDKGVNKETLTTNLSFDWSSDGSSIVVTIPDGVMTITYTNGAGESKTFDFATGYKKDAISFKPTDDGFRALELDIASFFVPQTGETIPDEIANFIKLGSYTFMASFDKNADGTDLFDDYYDETGEYYLDGFSNFISMFDVTDDIATISARAVGVTEAEGEAKIVVTLSNALDFPYTINWETGPGDQFGVRQVATPGEDYTPVSGTITFNPGEIEKTITVPVIFDGIEEVNPEAFTVRFNDFANYQDAEGNSYTPQEAFAMGFVKDGALLTQYSSYQNVSMSHSLVSTTVVINDTTVATKNNAGILDDADKDGSYLVTVRVQDGDDFQDFDVVLKFPDWDDSPRPLADSYAFLNPDQKIIEMTEHTSLFTGYNSFEAIEGSVSQDPNWKLADGISSDGLELASRRVEITDWINVDATSQDQSVFVSTNSGLRAKNPGISKSRIVDEANLPPVVELPAIPNPTVSSVGETTTTTPAPVPAPTPTPTPTPTDDGTTTPAPTPAPTPTDDGTETPAPTPEDNIPYGPRTYEILVNSTNPDGSVSLEYTDAWIILLDDWGLWGQAGDDFSQALTILAVIVSENSTSGIWSLPEGAIITEGSELDNIEFWTAYDEALVTFGFDLTPTTSFQDVMDRVWDQFGLSDYRTGFTIIDDPVQTNFTEYDAGPFNAEVLKYTTLSDSGAVQITLEQGLQLWAQTILGGSMEPGTNQQMFIVDADVFANWLSQVTGIAVPMPATSTSYEDLDTTEFYEALSVVIAGSPGFVNNFDDATQVWFDNVPNPDAVQGWELKTNLPDSLYDWLIRYPVNEGKFSLDLQDPTPFLSTDEETPNIEVTAIPDDGTIEKADGTVLKIGDILTPEEVTQLSYTPTIALIENSTGDTFQYSVGDDSVTVTLDKGNSGTSENVTFTWFNPIHVDNLDSLFTDGTGQSPTYSYKLSGLPADGETGSATVTTTMFNGRDWSGANQLNNSFYGGPESDPTKKLETSLTFNWSSDGQTLTFDIPDQQVVATLTSADGSTETVTWENVNKDFISVSIDENGQPKLDLQITSLLLGSGQGSGVDLSDFINVGRYGLEVDFEGLSWSDKSSNNGPFSNFASMIDVTANKVTVYSQDVVAVEGEEAVFTINLSMAHTEDVYVDFELQPGSSTGSGGWANEYQDYEQITGSVLIPAGQTSVEVSVPVYIDDQNEGVESFRITFPDFNAVDENGITIAQYNGVNMSHPFGTVEALILNQEVETTRYKGYKLNITNAPEDGWGDVRINERDNNNNPIKDNKLFYIHREDGEYYLKVHGGTLDFDAPQDSNKDNVYEITLSIIHYGQGNEDSVMTEEEMIIVVREGQDPSLTWETDDDQRFVQEHNAPVASLQTVQAGEKELEAYFSVGYSLPIRVNTNEVILDSSGSPESVLRWSHNNSESIVYTITGGADAEAFNILNGEVYFNTRPSFANPTDADNDNIYEVEITATAGSTVISKNWKIQVGESSTEDLSKVASPPSELAVFTLKEKPELIGDSQAPRNIVGSDGNDLIKIDPHQFQYIHGGFGDDTIDPGRNWGSHGHVSGGEGADIFLIRSNYMIDSGNFGIRDYAQPWDPNAKDGINGYDQNRDGTLDLGSELDWTNVVLIADFTPGLDKIALTVSGDSGFNRKDLTSENISFVQGTGELADHTLIVTTETNRGFANDTGILGVLLDTDATTLDVNRDVDTVGAQYEAILGQINIGAETVKINDTEGNPVSVQQLPNGQYLWFEADYNVKDNSALHQIFTVSTDGIIYAGRPSEIDYENPRDADKDNYYEFVITARLFDNLVLEPQSWGYNVDWNQSTYSSEIKISSVLNIQDDINDNLGKVSIAEANYLNADGTLNAELVELVLRQISAVQSSVQDLDFRSIAEEINFDFSRFTSASTEELAQDWFQEDMARRFDDFGREMEETFDRNLINKYSNYTDASQLGNVVGDAGDNQIYGIEANETIFGKAGDDTIAGGAGDDVIFGDAGQDTLSGGDGDDRLDGGSGADRLIADTGNDVLDGGSGNDILDLSVASELPEFISGGTGDDTLVLAGMPTNLGSTDLRHDNTAYNGIDLKKIVSAKQTWTSYDEQGNQVNEEGWSNRVESIENIDLRDSQSLVNVPNVEEPYDGFRLSENYFSVTDYVNGEATTYKSTVIPYTSRFIELAFGDADTVGTDNSMALSTKSVLNLDNLQNLFNPDSNLGTAPIFSFDLESVPGAGQQGSLIVTFTLKDGHPDYWFAQAPGQPVDDTLTQLFNDNQATKSLKAKVKINWSSDGTNVSIKVPEQTVQVTYENSEGLAFDAEYTNDNTLNNVISVSEDSEGGPQLDLNLVGLFASVQTMDLSSFFDIETPPEGSLRYTDTYHLTVDFEGLDIQAAASQDSKSAQPFSAIQSIFKVSNSTAPVMFAENVSVNEADGTATITVNLSSASENDISGFWAATPYRYGFLTDDNTLTYAEDVSPSDFGETNNLPSGNFFIAAGETSTTFTINIANDGQREGTEHSLVYVAAQDDVTGVQLEHGSRYPQLSIENSDTFNDVLNISLDTLWRMSWDNRTWTIRGDDTDTVRLVGYESSWTQSDGTVYEYFEPFRKNGTQTIDGVDYNIYDLWDARVLIEAGVTVIYKKRDLGKVASGENESPNFWYRYKTVNEEQTSVFGKVRDSWDGDGDSITFSIDTTYGDGNLFTIDSETGELTWKVAPDYESPTSINAQGISDFSGKDGWQMRNYNQYQVKVLGDDGSGETNAVTSQTLWIDVRNIPEGTFDGNRVPFFRDMWGEETQFIDDATDQSIKIKGFDLDFDPLTWKILGVWASGDEGGKGWGNLWGNYFGRPVSDAPLQVDSNGVLSPKTTLNYEDGYTRYEVMFQITDGKSDPITKQYHFTLKDSIADGTFEVIGHAHVSGYLSGATVWQDIDNDGIQDASEPFALTDGRGQFKLSLNKATQDSPILLKGGLDMGTGMMNDKVIKINSDLAFSANRNWGEYSLTPLSHVTLEVQNLDRSINDKKALIDISKALGFENGWVEGEGNYHGHPFYTLNSSWFKNYPGDWDVHQLNLFIAANMVNIIGDVAAKGALTITNQALSDIIAKAIATTGAASVSNVALTATQIQTLTQAAYDAAMESIAELVTGQTAFDGFRLGKTNPVTITDHEISSDGVVTKVIHTPGYTASNGVLTMDSDVIEINQTTLQGALNLESGSKGLLVEVSVGSLPTTSESIQFSGKLIDGTDSVVDLGERSIEVRFNVTVDPTQEVGSANYIYVPDSEDITVIYTGEDGSVTETTIEQAGAMVTVELPQSGGAPILKVDILKVFEKGMPKSDLASYFADATGSSGQYYSELNFVGSSLQTSDGQAFTKVIAPFSVADSPVSVAYISDITINESRGWAQLEVSLSKAAEEDFVINYKFEGGDATRDEDYWWWSDQDGYRQITFLKGQKNAIINLDVRNDDVAESTETFNVSFAMDSDSVGKAKLGNDEITVTIIDDDSGDASAALNNNDLTTKILAKISSAIATELKSITDGNSGSLNSSTATYSDILASNSDVTDIATYINTAISAESDLFDSIIAYTLDLTTLWTSYLRGPTLTNSGNSIDAPVMAADIAALALGINNLDMSQLTGIAASDQQTAITAISDAIFSQSGFKFNGPANIVDNMIVADKTVSNSSVYDNLLVPAQAGMQNTNWDNIQTASIGTSGDDTTTVTYVDGQGRDVFYSGAGGDDTITIGSNTKGFIHGGAGDDILKSLGVDYHRFEGGPGNDILSAGNIKHVLYKGDSGNDTFVIEASSSFWNMNTNNLNGYDRDGDGQVSYLEHWDRPAVILDFKSGEDKIGLKGNWANKTLVVVQGTGEYSNDTMLFDSVKDSSGNYYKLWAIVANTNASTVTTADFVTVDSSYNTAAISTSLSDFTFDSAIETAPGTLVGSVASSVNIVTLSEAGITFAITGGVDKDLFDIDATSGLLTFKEAATVAEAKDFDRNGSYLVEVTATSASDTKSGSMSITVSEDKTAPSLSNLSIDKSIVEGVPVISISGLATDNASGIERVQFRIKNVETGNDKWINAYSSEISDDGTFTTQTNTFGKDDPEGIWYISYYEVYDTNQNSYRYEVQGHLSSGVIKETISNPLYLGAFDTSVPSLDSIAISYTVDSSTNITTLVVSGTTSDDSSGAQYIQIELKNNDTGTTKWINAYQNNGEIKEDGSFSKSIELQSTDPAGIWYVQRVEVTDFAGNRYQQQNEGVTTALASADIPNALSASATDKLAPVFSDVTLSSSVNSEGKTYIQATVEASDNESGIYEIQVQWKHAKTEHSVWHNATFTPESTDTQNYIDSDGNYVLSRELYTEDPSGLYYIARVMIKDAAGRQWEKDVEGYSSWKTIQIDNTAYTGSSSGDPSGSGDSTAPTLSDLVMTTQVSGSNTQLVLTGTITEAGSFNYGYFHYGIKGESQNLGNFWLNSDQINSDGKFSITRDLGQNVKPGTYIIKDYTLRDSAQNRTSETLRQTESSIAGQEVTITNDSYVADTSAPVITNVSMSTVTSGSSSTIKITGTITEANFNYGYFHIRNKDVPTFNEQSVYLSRDSINSDGIFTITREVESNYPPGTYFISRYYAYDNSNNRTQEEIQSASGSPLFNTTTVVENAGYVEDFVAPQVSNVVLSSVNNLDNTISLKITGTITETNFNYGYFYVKVKGGSFQQNINIGNSDVNDNGTFSIKQTLNDGAPTGTYYISQYYLYDESSGQIREEIGNNSTDSALFNTSVNISADPTSIAFTATSIDEQQLGVSLGKVKVNGDSSNSSIYTYVIGGKDSSLLEISSLGYLRLKSDVKLDASYKSSLDFTLKATGTSGASKTETYSISVNEVTSTADAITLTASTGATGFAAGVNENAAGATVGTLSRSDGTTKTYSLITGSDNFEISGSTLKLKDSVSFNKEATETYLVSVQDSDGNKVHFDVSVLNVNEAPTTISLSSAYMSEGVAGITVGSIVPGDPDVSDTFTYELTGTDAGSFEIVSGSLKLKDSVTATHATKSSYSVTIKATDAAGLNATNSVTVNVLPKYTASIAAKPGTAVTTLPADGYSTNVGGTTFTYSIVGGDDSSLFEVNSSTGALSFKTAKAIETPVDASMDNIYDVEILMISDTGSSQIAKIGVTVQNDSVAPVISNLTLNYAVDSDDSKTTVTITGKVLDDASEVQNGYIQIKDSFTGKTMYLGFGENDIKDDGSFAISRVMQTNDPNGTWYIYNYSATDSSGNRINNEITGITSASVTKTIPNALYSAGSSDKTAPVISDLALSYKTAGGTTDPTTLTITGKVADVSEVTSLYVQLKNSFNNDTIYKGVNTSEIEDDGTFSVSHTMGTKDTTGTWYIYNYSATDEYGNRINNEITGLSSAPTASIAADVPNPLYLGSTDKEAPVMSNLSMSSNVSDVSGKTTVYISGQVTDALNEVENFYVQIKHAKSGNTKYLGGNKEGIDANGLFTINQTLESNDPNGTWYIYNYSVTDAADNRINNEITGLSSAVDSISMTNALYTGSEGGDLASGIDTTAPALSNVTLSVVDIDGVKHMKVSADIANDPYDTTWSYGYVRVNNVDVPSQNSFNISFDDNNSNGETDDDGTFTGFYNLESNSKAPGTYIITYVQAQDDTGNRTSISTDNVGVSIYGDAGTVSYTNSSYVTDTTAPALSNVTLSVVDIDGVKHMKVSADIANDPYDTTWSYGYVRVNNVDVPSQNSFNISFDDNNSNGETDDDGTFTGFYNLESNSKAPGTYIITYVQAQDDTGNRTSISTDNVGVSIYGDAGTVSYTNSSYVTDTTAPALSNVTLSVVDIDGVKHMKVSADIANDPYDTTWSYGYVRVNNVDVPSQNSFNISFDDNNSNGETDDDGTFTGFYNLESNSKAPGTYIITYVQAQDDTGNRTSISTDNVGVSIYGDSGTTTVANAPTAIALSSTSVDEEALGATVGKIQVNGSDAGALYSFTIGGDDASLLEVSSLGYLKLKAASKLDYETDAQLNFTLTAKNELNESKTTSFSLTVNDVLEAVSSSIDISLDFAPILDLSGSNNTDGLDVDPGMDNFDNIRPDQVSLIELGIELEGRENDEFTTQYNESASSEIEIFVEEDLNEIPDYVGALSSDSPGISIDDLEEDFLIINDVI